MKQLIISLAIILSVAGVLISNGLVENVQEVNSLTSSGAPSYSEATSESSVKPVLAPADLEEVLAQEVPSVNEAAVLPAELEYVFDAKFKEDGYIVEIYREFEIYKDAAGNVIKEVPTSNFEYMRYKE
ncbi:hypothetical protein ACOJQI_11040 [Bacillus salacetis]|uniref:hypothetical protein n=1 Tax=Bacillus salacetis TaxID=2315464 RepID=UPI003BA025B3